MVFLSRNYSSILEYNNCNVIDIIDIITVQLTISNDTLLSNDCTTPYDYTILEY